MSSVPVEGVAPGRSPGNSFSVTRGQSEYSGVALVGTNCESSLLLAPVFSMR